MAISNTNNDTAPASPTRSTAKPSRKRPPGVPGTNVHSSSAGISVYNALLDLKPPPPGAAIGSRHLPWLRLTDWEIMKLRQKYKKSAKWKPSDGMVKREIEARGRGPMEFSLARSDHLENAKPFVDEDGLGLREWRTRVGLPFATSADAEEVRLSKGIKRKRGPKEAHDSKRQRTVLKSWSPKAVLMDGQESLHSRHKNSHEGSALRLVRSKTSSIARKDFSWDAHGRHEASNNTGPTEKHQAPASNSRSSDGSGRLSDPSSANILRPPVAQASPDCADQDCSSPSTQQSSSTPFSKISSPVTSNHSNATSPTTRTSISQDPDDSESIQKEEDKLRKACSYFVSRIPKAEPPPPWFVLRKEFQGVEFKCRDYNVWEEKKKKLNPPEPSKSGFKHQRLADAIKHGKFS